MASFMKLYGEWNFLSAWTHHYMAWWLFKAVVLASLNKNNEGWSFKQRGTKFSCKFTAIIVPFAMRDIKVKISIIKFVSSQIILLLVENFVIKCEPLSFRHRL